MPDVQYGGEPAAEAGRNRALVQLHVVDGVRVEYGEEAEHVGRIVDRRFVEQDEVLVGPAAADAQSGREIAGGFNAWEECERPDRVGLTEDDGHQLDRLDVEARGAHLRDAGIDVGGVPRRGDGHFLELERLRRQAVVPGHRLGHRERVGEGEVSHRPDSDDVSARLHAQDEEPILIALGRDRDSVGGDDRVANHFAVRRRMDEATYSNARRRLGDRGNDAHNQREDLERRHPGTSPSGRPRTASLPASQPPL